MRFFLLTDHFCKSIFYSIETPNGGKSMFALYRTYFPANPDSAGEWYFVEGKMLTFKTARAAKAYLDKADRNHWTVGKFVVRKI
jgi:hypothetical protein